MCVTVTQPSLATGVEVRRQQGCHIVQTFQEEISS